jgi:hypothetical protein
LRLRPESPHPRVERGVVPPDSSHIGADRR